MAETKPRSRSKAKGDSKEKADSSPKASGQNGASKAKLPLIAGGAAIAGAAGGAALAYRQAKHGASPIKKAQAKFDSHDIAKALGSFGGQVGALAGELRRTREAADAEDRPTLELLLRGIAARR
jgi:hypothetical protein